MHDASDLGRWGNRLLAGLPSDTLALLERDLRQVSLDHGAVCFEAGAPIDRVYFPQSGMISLLVATSNGDRIETGTIGREGAAGLQAGFGKHRSYSRAIIQIAGKLAVVSAEHFERVVGGNAQLRDLVFRYIGNLWSESQQIAACNAIHSAPARLCRWLLQTSDRIGDDYLPLTQGYLADMLGVRRTTVTLFAQELQRRGAIKYSRGKIMIADRNMLEAYACECYQAIRHETRMLAWA